MRLILANWVLILVGLFVVEASDYSTEKPKKHPGHEQPFGSSGPFVQLNETTDLSTRDFFDQYVKPKKGLIIRGMASKFPAFSLWSNDQYLRDVSRPYENYKLLVETQKKESRDQEVVSLSLNEFLDDYLRKEIYIVDEVPVYLKEDLFLPQQLQCGQAPNTLEQTMLWFSSGGTKSVTHTDDYENILCVFAGTKQLVMVDYYKYRAVANRLIDEPRGSYSSMDVDRVDYELYPGIEDLEYYRFNLSAGDCVYIPFKWIHQVRSYDRNIAVNYWFNFEKIFGNSVFSDECGKNKLDLSVSLGKYKYSSNKSDFYVNFRHYVMRQVNMGNRRISDWNRLILGDSVDTSEVAKTVTEIIKEFFDLIDFNGDGFLSDEELIELDENSIEHSAGLLNEIDDLIFSRVSDNDTVEDDEEPHEEVKTEL